MENGVLCKTEECSLQSGLLSPLPTNINFNEFDWKMTNRGIKLVQYADDIVVFAKSKRAAGCPLKSCRKYQEGKLKLKIDTEKNKYPCTEEIQVSWILFGRNRNDIYIRAHRKFLNKAKEKLKLFIRCNRRRNI